MRFCLLLVLFAPFGGCQYFRNPWTMPRPDVFTSAPTLPAILEHVNQNSAKVQSLRTSGAELTSSMSSFGAGADVFLERPQQFRLRAGRTLTGTQVDLGSNSQELWIWVGGLVTGGEPAMYFSRHDQLQQTAARQMIPIEPAWMVDAFGLPTFRDSDQHTGPSPVGKGRQEVRTTQQTPFGPLGKITIVDERYGDVLEQHLYDPQGKLMASSLTSNYAVDPLSGAWLPHQIEIRFPAMQSSITLNVKQWEVNKLEPPQSQLFVRPQYPNTRYFDLASVQPAQGAQSGAPAAAPQGRTPGRFERGGLLQGRAPAASSPYRGVENMAPTLQGRAPTTSGAQGWRPAR